MSKLHPYTKCFKQLQRLVASTSAARTLRELNPSSTQTQVAPIDVLKEKESKVGKPFFLIGEKMGKPCFFCVRA